MSITGAGDLSRPPAALPSRTRSRVAWGLAALALATVAAAALLAGPDHEWANFWSWAPTAVTFTVVGAVLVARVPRNAVSWLTLAFGLLMGIELLTLIVSEHADRAAQVSGVTEWTAWLRLIGIDLLVVLLIPLILLFPDGRLPSRRWRPVLWLTAAAGGVSTLVAGTTSANWNNPTDDNPNYVHLHPPFRPVPLGNAQGWYDLTTLSLLGLLLAAAAGLAWRYRRSPGLQREQIKWVLTAVIVMATAIAVSAVVFQGTIGSEATMPLLPLAIGVAVLRFRLYDIDRLVSRTVSYAVVTGCVLLVYGVIVSLATRLVPESSELAVAAATLAAAAVARPVLRRVQRWVDRRFNRPRFDAVATVERFGSDLRDEIEPDRIEHGLLAAVRDTLQPVTASVWVVTRS
jgi:hypothetical protein